MSRGQRRYNRNKPQRIREQEREQRKVRPGQDQRVKEQINTALIDKYVPNDIVHIEHLCYHKHINKNVLPPQMLPTFAGALTKLIAKRSLIMDSIQLSLFDGNDQPHKKCSTCPRVLPATTEYFHRNKSRKDGISHVCKECAKARARAYNAEHREQRNANAKEHYKNNRDIIIQKVRTYEVENKEQIYAHKKVYRKQNRNSIIASNKQYYEDNKEQFSEYSKKYKIEHPEAKRAYEQNRRALKKKAGGRITPKQLKELYYKQEGRCAYCQVELGFSRNSWHADHYIPLSKGGSNDISNIRISCPRCNLTKNDKLPHEWMRSREGEVS